MCSYIFAFGTSIETMPEMESNESSLCPNHTVTRLLASQRSSGMICIGFQALSGWSCMAPESESKTSSVCIQCDRKICKPTCVNRRGLNKSSRLQARIALRRTLWQIGVGLSHSCRADVVRITTWIEIVAADTQLLGGAEPKMSSAQGLVDISSLAKCFLAQPREASSRSFLLIAQS